MNIGILVYSYTGHTLSAAQRLETLLKQHGHQVTLESIKARDENPNQTQIQLTVIPDPTPYDRLIVACPVRGFQTAPVMKAYLSQWPILKDKPVACFVTHAFPFPGMGGKSAIKMMSDLIRAKQAKLVASAIINASKHESDIQQMLALLSDESTWK